jgi:hypothetical protein
VVAYGITGCCLEYGSPFNLSFNRYRACNWHYPPYRPSMYRELHLAEARYSDPLSRVSVAILCSRQFPLSIRPHNRLPPVCCAVEQFDLIDP